MKTKVVTDKKLYDNYLKYDLITIERPNTILGVWITNHNFKSKKNNENLEIKGEYEINVWYSYANNTKTNVVTRIIKYNEIIPSIFNANDNYHIRALGNPNCNKANIEDDVIIIEIFKQFEIEIINEVEIIEEKPKKIEELSIAKKIKQNYGKEYSLTHQEFFIQDKINEIIKVLNHLAEKNDSE